MSSAGVGPVVGGPGWGGGLCGLGFSGGQRDGADTAGGGVDAELGVQEAVDQRTNAHVFMVRPGNQYVQ